MIAPRTNVPEDKAALRRRLLAARSWLDAPALAAAGQRLAEAVAPLCAQAGTVAAYAALGTEPPTGPLLDALGETGVQVLLPVLLPDGDLDWAVHRPGEPLQEGPHGLREPRGTRLGPAAVARCGVVVVPALAADRQGHRLGRGGGSYDRVLPRARGLVVALVHDGELLPQVPHEPHDALVHAVAVPAAGVVRTHATLTA